MSNLTFDQNLIREHRAEPLEGHTVVVMERVGESGERFHSLLEPGDERVRRPVFSVLRGRASPYFAFALDASRTHWLTFKEHVVMAERPHEFDLVFSLGLRVTDPQLLVSTRARDPLGQVRWNVGEVVGATVAELPWAEVWHSFAQAGETVVSGTTAALKAFARDYGLAVVSLRLRAEFPSHAVDPDRIIHNLREEGRVRVERMDIVNGVRTRQAVLRHANAAREEYDETEAARRSRNHVLHEETTRKLAEFIGGSASPSELGDLQYALTGGPRFGAGGGPAALGSGSAAGALPAGTGGLRSVLADVVTLTHDLGPEIQCRRAQAALLHLVASVVADDSSQVTAEQNAHAQQLRALLANATHVPSSRTDALQRLADPARLRERLSS